MFDILDALPIEKIEFNVVRFVEKICFSIANVIIENISRDRIF